MKKIVLGGVSCPLGLTGKAHLAQGKKNLDRPVLKLS
jgi:hypothetical protein